MSVISASDLNHKYQWTATHGDDPSKTGIPDDRELNRQEGYEVLPFINRMAEAHGLGKQGALKIERMIHLCPSNLRSRKHIRAWIEQHWNSHA